MKIRTMNRNNLKEPRHEAFNYNTTALPFVGFFNETGHFTLMRHLGHFTLMKGLFPKRLTILL